MNQQFLFDKVPALLHGGDYNPDQWLKYPEVLAKDVELLKNAHINTVSMGIFAWAALEPEEGKYTFDWLDERINPLYENGIYTVLATPSGARPAWLDEKYPSTLRVTADDQRRHHGVRHNHCMTSPEYREKVRQINTQLAKRYGSHPGVILWHVSNEYGGECYCPLCAQKFREFLKEKYKTIDALNDAWWSAFWSHTYTSFDQIEPPFKNGETSMAALRLDWRRFTSWNTQDFMKAEIAPLKEFAPNIPVTTNFHLTDSVIHYELAKDLDVVSWDSYPLWHSEPQLGHVAAVTAYQHSTMRNTKQDKPFMLMESAPGQVNWQPFNKIRRPGMHRLTSLQAVANGSDTVQYFQMRKCRGSYEQYHGAVIDHEGTGRTRIYKEITQLGEDLIKLQPVAGSTIQAKAALVMDMPNRWAVELISGLSEHKQLQETAQAHYEAFTKTGLDLDVIDSRADFSRYQLLILPMFYMVSDEVGKRIKQFVANGGTVIASYLLAYTNETLLAHLGGFPGAGLKEVFGIWNEEIDALYPADRNAIVTFDNKRYEVRDYCEVIHLQGADILATYESDYYKGQPAVTVNSYGKGQAIYVAARTEDAYLTDLYRTIAQSLELPVMDLPANVEKHVREDEENTYTFLLNFNDATVFVEEPAEGVDLLTSQKASGLVVLPPYGVACIRSKK